MRFLVAWAAAIAACAQQLPPDHLKLGLARLSEEAETFARLAPRVIGEERLVQRALARPPRFRLRVGKAAAGEEALRYQTREIVSEYGYSTLKGDPEKLMEFRQVVAVDGKQVAKREKARETLTMGIRSDDDRRKKRMLQEFERHGLVGAATDFGQILLLFRRRFLEQYRFDFERYDRVGAEPARVYRYQQLGGGDRLVIFEGREATHRKLEGEVWLRQRDYLPLRITMSVSVTDGEVPVRHVAFVDYEMSRFALLLPVSVVHRETVADVQRMENRFAYSGYQMFGATSDVKFTFEEKQP